jgi:hypothetical protein
MSLGGVHLCLVNAKYLAHNTYSISRSICKLGWSGLDEDIRDRGFIHCASHAHLEVILNTLKEKI